VKLVARRGFGKSNVVADINVTHAIHARVADHFHITTPLLQSGITVNLPKRRILSTRGADSKEAVVVAMNGRGTLSGQKQIGEQDLYEFHSRSFSAAKSTGQFLKADTALPYERGGSRQRLRRAGVERIGLMAKRKRIEGKHL